MQICQLTLTWLAS